MFVAEILKDKGENVYTIAPEATVAELGEALDRAAERLGNGGNDAGLAARLEMLAANLDAGKDVDIEALPYHPPRGKVFILVDSICMSACLDAVDLWTRFGAVPGSECQIRDIVDPMTHQPTGEKAVYYRATLVEWQPGYATLYGSWLAASLYGESCAYVARLQRGTWQFQAEQACIYN